MRILCAFPDSLGCPFLLVCHLTHPESPFFIYSERHTTVGAWPGVSERPVRSWKMQPSINWEQDAKRPPNPPPPVDPKERSALHFPLHTSQESAPVPSERARVVACWGQVAAVTATMNLDGSFETLRS